MGLGWWQGHQLLAHDFLLLFIKGLELYFQGYDFVYFKGMVCHLPIESQVST